MHQRPPRAQTKCQDSAPSGLFTDPGLFIILALGLLMLGTLMVTLATIQWAAGRLRGAEAGAVLLLGSAFASRGAVMLAPLAPTTAQIGDAATFGLLIVALVVWLRITRLSRVSS